MIIRFMVSNDKNTDDLQEGHIINYNTLKTDVIKAIEKPFPESFKNKTSKECKYVQKVAEIYLSIYGIFLTLSTFTFAIGAAYIIAWQPLQNWVFLIIGIIFCIFGILFAKYWPKVINIFGNYIDIILDAEEKILEESVEPKPQQETNNFLSKNLNPPSIDYIKAQLDLLKLIMAGFLGGMLVLSNSILQTSKNDIKYQLIFFLSILFILMFKLMTDYKNYSKKLNEK